MAGQSNATDASVDRYRKRVEAAYPCWCGHRCGHPWAHDANPPAPDLFARRGSAVTTNNNVPSARQADMLSAIAAHGERGRGMLGVDLRTYDALLRRGWIEDRPVQRGFGLGPGQVAVTTAAGRAALARVTPPDSTGATP